MPLGTLQTAADRLRCMQVAETTRPRPQHAFIVRWAEPAHRAASALANQQPYMHQGASSTWHPCSALNPLRQVSAKGKTMMRRGMGRAPQPQMPPTPPVDPENVEFVVFVRSKKVGSFFMGTLWDLHCFPIHSCPSGSP